MTAENPERDTKDLGDTMADEYDVPEYDTTEKVEEIDVGFRLTVESTRGTGTRDEDTVKMTAKTETYPDEIVRNKVASDVEELMNRRRAHQTESDEE